MRPVRFVALSEDGQAFVLADEVGRLLALPIDDRVHAAVRGDHARVSGAVSMVAHPEIPVALSPRDIQARIRAGESAEQVARAAGVAIDRVLRYAGPVLQERAMLAQQARRTRLTTSDKGASLADVVQERLSQHGVEAEKISWDAFRREDGTWRVVATWPSGKATAQANWALDRTRQSVSPHDDMATYLCSERPGPVHATDLLADRASRGLMPPARGDNGRGGHEPMRPADELIRRTPSAPSAPSRPADPGRGQPRHGHGLTGDPIRSGRDALLASLDRPLGAPAPPPAAEPAAMAPHARSAERPSIFDDDPDAPKDVPAVPSLAVLRPRRTGGAPATGMDSAAASDKPRKRLPSWDDVLFGSAPARESS